MKRIVTIGGGHAHAQVLQGMKQLPDVQITAISGNSDSGGKTKKAIIDYGASSYLGDLTRCIAALCPDESIAEALNYRFHGGSLDGWTLRHMMLLALEKTNPDCLDDALEEMCKLLGISHRAIPITRGRTKLKVRFRVGNQIEEEADLDTITQNPLWHPQLHEVKDVFLEPDVPMSDAAGRIIQEADYCVLGPGSLFGSTIAALLPQGVLGAFQKSSAKIILFLNLMTVRGETHDMDAADLLEWIKNAVGRLPDYTVYDDSEYPKEIWNRYSGERLKLGDVRHLPHDKNSRLGRPGFPGLVKAKLSRVTDEGLCHDPDMVAKILQEIFDEAESSNAAAA